MPSSNSLPALTSTLTGKLNSAIVCLSHSWGGLEQVAASDALDLGSTGIPVRALCLKGSPFHERISGSWITPVPVEFEPRNYLDLNMRAEIGKLVGSGVNLVHTHQPSLLGSLVPWLWRFPSVGLVATRHIMNSHNKKDFIHRAIYSRVDSLIVVSQAIRMNVLQTHAMREKKVQVIHLGLDFNRFNPARVRTERQRDAWNADPETVVIGLVGRIDPAKGQATFIKAAAGLIKNQTKDQKLKFVLVGAETIGSDTHHQEELKEMVNQFRLENSVVFAGFQENIPEVMKALDIVVMPSRQEAFGLVAIEAMAMECPVVISQGGSAEEIVGKDEFGLTIRPDDAFDLQRQLRYLLDHPEARARMGKKARTHVQANYSRDVRLTKMLGIYERVLRRRRAFE